MKNIQNPSQVRINQGDNLRTVSSRALGDHTRWIELVELNHLRPPYIIESIDPLDRLPQTLVWGDWILIPIPQQKTGSQIFSPDILGSDIEMTPEKTLACHHGDLAIISGINNLDQAVRHRFKCERGNNFAHPKYGSDIAACIGMGLLPVIEIFSAMIVKQTLLDDPRIASLLNLNVAGHGDTLNCTAQAKTQDGNSRLDLNLSFPLLR